MTADNTSTAGHLTDQAKQTAGHLTDQAKQTASHLTDQAKGQAVTQLTTGKNQTAQTLGAMSHAVSQVGQQLRQNDQTQPYAHFADQAAEQIQRASSYLQNRDVRQIVNEAESLARSNPALVLGGAFAIGMLAARFLKSGSQQGMGQSSQYNHYNRYSTSSGANTGWNTSNRSQGSRYGQYDQYGRQVSRQSSQQWSPTQRQDMTPGVSSSQRSNAYPTDATGASLEHPNDPRADQRPTRS